MCSAWSRLPLLRWETTSLRACVIDCSFNIYWPLVRGFIPSESFGKCALVYVLNNRTAPVLAQVGCLETGPKRPSRKSRCRRHRPPACFPQDDFRPASVHSPGRRFFCHDPDFGRNPPLLSNGDVPSTWPGAERPPHQGMACHGRNRSRRKSWMARNERAPPSWQFRAPPQLPRRQEIRPARSSNLTCPICRCAGGRWSPPGR